MTPPFEASFTCRSSKRPYIAPRPRRLADAVWHLENTRRPHAESGRNIKESAITVDNFSGVTAAQRSCGRLSRASRPQPQRADVMRASTLPLRS
jgi:hypothetical protein